MYSYAKKNNTRGCVEGIRDLGYESDSDGFFFEAVEDAEFESTSSSEGLEPSRVRIIGAQGGLGNYELRSGELIVIASSVTVGGIALLYFLNYYVNPSSTFYAAFSFSIMGR